MSEKQKYYLGLDCGTSSVGWAVTDEKYNLLRRKGKTLWGMRLFDEAKTAADRRVARSSRRRLARREQRIRLLRSVFYGEMLKVDKFFFERLDASFYLEEDKRFSNMGASSRNSLFSNADGVVSIYKNDSDFYSKYPTIWHLREAIVKKNDRFDIREYYLAILHIMKHRGHFLSKSIGFSVSNNFNDLWQDFRNAIEDGDFGVKVREDGVAICELLLKKDMSWKDKKQQIKPIIASIDKEYDGSIAELAGLICGLSSNIRSCFGLSNLEKPEGADETDKICFGNGKYDEDIIKLRNYIGNNEAVLNAIESARRVYEYFAFSDLMRGEDIISSAMVNRYNQHKKDLKNIKEALKPYRDDYEKFFGVRRKTNKSKKSDVYYFDRLDNKSLNYVSYINNPIKNKEGEIIGDWNCSQEEINDELAKIFKRHGISGSLLKLAEAQKLLPKQRGSAKGSIPYQAHHEELKKILEKLQNDYPSFGKKDKEGYTGIDKILSIHKFRVPFYCGPIKKGGDFSWAREELKEIVTPWNFDKVLNEEIKAERRRDFILRMSRHCSYLSSEYVLPEKSPLYQQFMILNDLNNLSIDGKKIDKETKNKLYEIAFGRTEEEGGFAGGTLKGLERYAINNGIIAKGVTLTGIDEQKALPCMSTIRLFKKSLGADFVKDSNRIEEIVKNVTLFGEDRELLRYILVSDSLCSDNEAAIIANCCQFSGWGRLSLEFLNGITVNYNGADKTIIDLLKETTDSLQVLLSKKYLFLDEIEKRNKESNNKRIVGGEEKYNEVDELYCSPAVKRSVRQAMRIVDELTGVMGCSPNKIFLEATRGGDFDKKRKLSRKKELESIYSKITGNQDAKAILHDLRTNYEDNDRRFQSKKLYLYYRQMCHCAYCNEPIDLESDSCDIDHIYPRSKTKDDSIENNLVLVHRKCNLDKSDIYPLNDTVISKKKDEWRFLKEKGLMSTEKYRRLIRREALTDDELAGFVSRQITETSQSVKIIRNLLQKYAPNTKIILVKAGEVSELRKKYSEGIKQYANNTKYKLKPMPEFVKVRALNDMHHAKDAYLNIVVGNVLNGTFTDNPYEWIRQKSENGEREKYSIKTELLFRPDKIYKNKKGDNVSWPFVNNWDFEKSILIMQNTMRRSDVLWSRASLRISGELFNLQPVKRSKGLVPANKRNLSTEKYGGYNSVSTSYFALIENKKNERIIVSVPVMIADKYNKNELRKREVSRYIDRQYMGCKVIIPEIKSRSLLIIDGFSLILAAEHDASRLAGYPGVQFMLPFKYNFILKRVLNSSMKLKEDKKYLVTEKDGISDEDLVEIYNAICAKRYLYNNSSKMSKYMDVLIDKKNEFAGLSIEEKCMLLSNLFGMFEMSGRNADLSKLGGTKTAGRITFSKNLSKNKEVKLICRSTTGLYEKEIDLKTVQPGQF